MLANDQNQIWDTVRNWSTTERLRLASRLIQSIERDNIAVQNAVKPAEFIGIWKSTTPPSDEEVERILEDERLRKYG